MESRPRPRVPKIRNPITTQKHRHEVFWQITIPVIIGAVLIIAIGVGIAVGANIAQISKLASVSLISLIIPAMIVTLLLIAINTAAVILLVRLIQMLPYYSRAALNFFILIQVRVGKFSDFIAEPILRVHSWRASAGQFRHSLRHK